MNTAGCEASVAKIDASLFAMRVPHIGMLTSASVEGLVGQLETARDEGGYGSSDIGARWVVKDSGGKHVASVTYNGRIIWEVE
jgi:hypothetical protein